MTTELFIERLMGIVDETILPLIGLYFAWLVRRWVQGRLELPPPRDKQ